MPGCDDRDCAFIIISFGVQLIRHKKYAIFESKIMRYLTVGGHPEFV